MKKNLTVTLIVLFLLALPVRAQTNLLHSFAYGASDGSDPWGSPIISGSTLYGMTTYGGTGNYGTIFKVQTNGTGFTLLHSFAGGTADGAYPSGDLILSGTTLYGMTVAGGYGDCGTIFKIQTNGTGFTLLHGFPSSGVTEGRTPLGSLVLSGSTLYGMTQTGGLDEAGTIFKIQTDGSNFTTLRVFNHDDGANPEGSLILSGSTLYGMTAGGGINMWGTIFTMQTNGSGFLTLHKFVAGTNDGGNPLGSLVLSGSTLYGMTNRGGDGDWGTVFKIQTTGSGFALLHEFAGGAADGAGAWGSLILSGSTLYGMTPEGGDGNWGTIFNMQTDGSSFALLHEFGGVISSDGATPYGSLILSGSTLYGMTHGGGYNGHGSVFSMPFSPSTASLDFVGSWYGQGVYYRNSDSGTWTSLATPADLIACGDLYGDGIDDLIGIWSGQAGVWVKSSANGNWAYLGSSPRHIAAGDMNGDGRVDLLGTWDGQGVFYRNSINGSWALMATPATLITAGDLDGDGKGDLIGIWPSQAGVWVKYSITGNWSYLGSSPRDMATGDMNGDGRADLIGTWDGQGVFYRDSISGTWVRMATPADQVASGDLDGDGTDDLIGIWAGQAGVWVKSSSTGQWAYIGSSAHDITAGKMSGGMWNASPNEPTPLNSPNGGFSDGPSRFIKYDDFSAQGPGGNGFLFVPEQNLVPRLSKPEVLHIPGPGEPGFKYALPKNIFPVQSGVKRKTTEK